MCSETSKHSWCPPQAWSPLCHTTWQENGLMDTNKEAIVTLFTHMMLINSKVWPPIGHVVFFPNRQGSNNSRRTWSSHSHMPRSQGKTKEKPVICSELVLPKRAFVYDYVYLIYSEKFNWKNDPFFLQISHGRDYHDKAISYFLLIQAFTLTAEEKPVNKIIQKMSSFFSPVRWAN